MQRFQSKTHRTRVALSVPYRSSPQHTPSSMCMYSFLMMSKTQCVWSACESWSETERPATSLPELSQAIKQKKNVNNSFLRHHGLRPNACQLQCPNWEKHTHNNSKRHEPERNRKQTMNSKLKLCYLGEPWSPLCLAGFSSFANSWRRLRAHRYNEELQNKQPCDFSRCGATVRTTIKTL